MKKKPLIEGKYYWVKYLYEKPEPVWTVAQYSSRFHMFHFIGKRVDVKYCEWIEEPLQEPG